MFNNPLLLWFLPLLVVPVLLHLITQYRMRTVELSTFRFLMDSYVQQRRRMRLLEWLLLLLRTAFVGLIIFALSRPELANLGWLIGGGGSGEVVMVIDAAPSMAVRSGGSSSLERAKGAAAQLVKHMGADSRVTLIRAADKPEVVLTRFASKREAIVDAIDSIQISAGGGDIADALDRVFGVDAGSGARRVYVLSDLQQQRWQQLEGHPLQARIGGSDQLAVIDVGSDEPVTNLAVTGDQPRALRAVVGLPVMLSATVVNQSDEASVDSVLSVMLDEQQVRRQNVYLRPGQKATYAMVVTPSRAGALRGRFELPGDAFVDDDSYLFCLQVSPQMNVVIVTLAHDGEAADAPSLYLQAVFESPMRARRDFLQSRQLAAAMKVTTVTVEQLSPGVLEVADVVVLADAPISSEQGLQLRRYVESGGGVLILPGPHVGVDAYRGDLLGPVAGSDQPIMHLGEAVGDPEDESTFRPIDQIELSHPIFSAFVEVDAEYFQTTLLYRYSPIAMTDGPARAASLQSGGWVEPPPVGLMRLSDGSVVLAEARLGGGRLVLAGFGPTTHSSNLPLKPEFVPMLLRCAAHLRRAAQVTAPPAVGPNDATTIAVTDRWAQAHVEVVDPSGKPHTIEMHRSGRELVGAMQETGSKGFYHVNVLPRTQGAPERIERNFAVNLEAEQVDFASMGEVSLKALFLPHEVNYLRSVPNDPVLAGRLTQRREMWRWLIGLMFGVIFFEFLLATLRPAGAGEASGVDADGSMASRWRRRIGGAMDRAGIWVALPKVPAERGGETAGSGRR
ncbi:MAG: hypothetical protein CMJ49_00985 [Planctomycetaceae bacterium]|nr:hypothetical protein [Planctomycetaceae bacterium]